MGFGTALSRITGFGRLAVIAWAIGGAESKLPDTYELANTLPNVFFHLILGEVVVTAFVPVFVEYVTRASSDEARSLSSTVIALTLLISTAATIAAVASAGWIIKIYTFRLEGPERIAQEEVGAFFLRLFLPQIIFYTTGLVISGLLNAHRKFTAPTFAPIANNLIVAGVFVAFGVMHSAGIPTLQTLAASEKLLLGIGTTAGVVVQTLLLLPSVRRIPGGWFRLSDIRLDHPALPRIRALAKFALAYVLVNQVRLWMIKAFANETTGGVAAYDTSFILYSLPYGIFAVSIFTALVPTLSEHHVKGDVNSFRSDLSLGLRMTLFVMLPAAAGFVALGGPIVRLLFQRGVFGSASTALFSDTLIMMALGLPAYAALQQITRAYYSMQDTRTPFLISSIGAVTNIGGALLLFGPMGVPGLALSHAISYAFIAAVAWVMVTRKVGSLGGDRFAGWLVGVVSISIASGLIAWLVGETLAGSLDVQTFIGQLLQVSASIAAGAVVFAGGASLLGFDELKRLSRLVRRA